MKFFIGLGLILIAVASTATGLVIKNPGLVDLDGKEVIQNKVSPYTEDEKMNMQARSDLKNQFISILVHFWEIFV